MRRAKVPDPACVQALAHVLEVAGGPVALSRKIGITSQAIAQWRQIPIDQVLAIEAALGIAREDLRPDYFRVPPLTSGRARRR